MWPKYGNRRCIEYGPARWRWNRCHAKMWIAMPHYLIRREPIPAGARRVQCQYTWLSGCYETATWQVGCGSDVRFYCDSHEGPPCGGVFLGDFVITRDTTRQDLLSVVSCGSHRIHSVSGRDVHELWCCACGEWVGDTQDPEIADVVTQPYLRWTGSHLQEPC